MSLPLFVRRVSVSERNRLDEILREPPNVRGFLRAKAIDLSSKGWKVHEIDVSAGPPRTRARWSHLT